MESQTAQSIDKSIKREVACKVSINQILEGKYIKEEGWNPNKVVLDNGISFSRVNLIAVIVDSSGQGFKQITIDDSTGRINLRSFDNNNIFKDVEVGNVILLIGKPREYNGEKFIIPEIIRKVLDPKWIEVRKLELILEGKKNPVKKLEEKKYVEEEISEETFYDKIMNIIKRLDTGSGVLVDEIIRKSNSNNAEQLITELIKRGEIFEIGHGRVKVLE